MYHVYKHALFHLWWKQNLIEHQKVSEYYENDCLQNFLLLFIFLVIAKFVKKSHIYARTHFIFLKTVVKQTWNSFNTKCGPQWKDWKSSYQIWQILVIFFNCSNFSLKQCKGLRATTIVKDIEFEGVWGKLESKTGFWRQLVTKY